MSRIKKIVFAALAAAAFTGAAGAVHLDRPVQGSSSVSAGIQSSSAASEVVRLTNSARSQNGYAALVEDGALSDAAAVRAREIAHSFSHTRPSGASFSSALSESGVSYLRAGENILRPEKRIRGRECVDEFAGPPREHSEQQLLAHRLCERQYRRHALLGAAFRGLTGADRHSLPAALNARPRADCINRSDSAICTDFFRHRAGDFLPPYRSTLPLKVQPVQALAEQVSIF